MPQSSPTLTVLQTELQQLLQAIQETVNQQVESSLEDLKVLKTKSAKLEEQLLVQQDKLDSLTEQVEGIEADIMTLGSVNDDQKRKNDALIKEYSTLSVKITNVKQQIMNEQGTEELVRKDLAVRIVAADEREKNLKLREQKVSQSERQVQANADLLGL